MEEAALRQLREQICAGSVTALGDYLTHQRPRMLALLRHLMGDHLLRVVELDDLFQELSRSAIAALPKIPKDELNVDKWLEQLARRRVVDAHREHFGAAKRAQGRNVLFSQLSGDSQADPPFEQLLIASMTSPSMAVSRNWRITRLQQAIQGLDRDQQQLLQLRYVEGLHTSQIAEMLDKSDGAIRVALSRIIARLQANLSALS